MGLQQDVEERTSMGLCDLLFAILSYRLYGYQHWSRKRLMDPTPSKPPSDDLTLHVLSLWLVPEHDRYRRFDDVVRDLPRAYPFSLPSSSEHAIDIGVCDVDLPPLPSRLERSRSRPKPPPIQILLPTLRGMVRSRHDLPDPPPQRLLRLPPR